MRPAEERAGLPLGEGHERARRRAPVQAGRPDDLVRGPLLEQVTTSLSREVANRKWQLEHWGTVAWTDLRQGPTLGVGTYGHVSKSLHKPSAKTYAVKAVPKAPTEVANTMAQLGKAYGDLGDMDKQLEYLETAVRIQEREFGPDHHNVAWTLAQFGFNIR